MTAHIKTLIVFSCVCFLMGACASSSPANAIPTGTPADMFTPFPSPPATATPKPTNAPATPTTEITPTPDPKFHELTQEEIDAVETINYIKISSAEKQQYADYIENHMKIAVSVKPAKLSESFTDFGYQKIQLNFSAIRANRNIVPRFALEIDGVKVIAYEVKLQNPDGTVYHGSFIVSSAGNTPTAGGDWRVYDTITKKFQQGSHRDFIIHLILESAKSNSAAKNPNATKLTNVIGQEDTWDPMRTKLIDTDIFTPDMSATIWWAMPMQ